MSVSNASKTLNRAAAIILSASVVVGVWGALADVRTENQNQVNQSSQDNLLTGQKTERQITDAMEQAANPLVDTDIWNRRLQSGFHMKPTDTVVDPAMASQVALPKMELPRQTQMPDSGLRLVGTVIEKDRSMAIAIDRNGKLAFCFVGALLQLEPDGVRIESVSVNSVDVSVQGKTVTWLMGQPLQFESMVNEVPVESTLPNPLRIKPKTGLIDELELINVGGSSVPL